MPSLREMREDIPVLAREILRRIAGGDAITLSPEAIASLQAYAFPGNVRELENVLERSLALCAGDRIGPEEELPTGVAGGASRHAGAGRSCRVFRCRSISIASRRRPILEALEKTRFNRTAAAKLLGITFRALRYRMERLGIN